MRTMLRIAVTASVLTGSIAVVSNASALEYPWCARYSDDHGGTNCGFSTFEQCEAARSGNGGICDRNLFYVQTPSPPAKLRKTPLKRD